MRHSIANVLRLSPRITRRMYRAYRLGGWSVVDAWSLANGHKL
jgi:hypothetical protein